MGMADVLKGEVTKVTDDRLEQMIEQAKVAAQQDPMAVRWKHWHWLAVALELKAARTENEALRKLRDTLTEECGALEDRLQEERRSQEETKREIHRAYVVAMETAGLKPADVTRILVMAGAEILMTAVAQVTGADR